MSNRVGGKEKLFNNLLKSLYVHGDRYRRVADKDKKETEGIFGTNSVC